MHRRPTTRLTTATLFAGLALSLTLGGCESTGDPTDTTAANAASGPITQQQQQAMTPDQVIDAMMQGNRRFAAGQVTGEDVAASRSASAAGQYPAAYVLSCVDSRVPVETVFDMGIGDLFVGRVAGNFENVDQLGSMEFATAAAGAKLVMVLGHGSCGAIKGAADGVELGNLTELLDELEPAVEAVHGHEGQRTSKNAAFIDEVVATNVQRTVADIRERSSVLADLERQGQIKIVGAVYDLESGRVSLVQ
jgi:carbonic anhydrase